MELGDSILKLREYEQGDKLLEEWRKEIVDRIVKLLEQSGFDHIANKSNKKTVTTFYYKEGIELVFCVIDKEQSRGTQKSGKYYAIIDKNSWDELKDLHPKFNISNDEKYVTIYLDAIPGDIGKYSGPLLHRFLKRKDKGGEWLEKKWEVDHVTHNGFINPDCKEFLRVCSGEQNKINSSSRRLARIQKDTLSFMISVADVTLQKEDAVKKLGIKKADTYYYSEEFKSEEELYKKVGEVEKLIYGDFRYDPLKDFSQTGYVLVYEKMLGKISHEEAEEYQRDYYIRMQPDIAKYYALLWD